MGSRGVLIGVTVARARPVAVDRPQTAAHRRSSTHPAELAHAVCYADNCTSRTRALRYAGAAPDTTFVNSVRPYIGNAKLFGFYLMDDPDPTGKYRPLCTADNLKAESDWIHTNVPGAKTYILLMSMSSSKAPSFTSTYNPVNSHVDLFGIAPYPCRTELNDCDYDMIDRYVAAAESWGVRRDGMVPVYQAFGAGNWVDDGGGRYALPTVGQLRQILARWETLVPTPEFDVVYSWGPQNAHVALESSPDLQAVFRLHNSATKAARP